MSMMAAERYSVTAKPWLKVRAFSILSTSALGMEWPFTSTAKRESTSGVDSQFSFSCDGNST